VAVPGSESTLDRARRSASSKRLEDRGSPSIIKVPALEEGAEATQTSRPCPVRTWTLQSSRKVELPHFHRSDKRDSVFRRRNNDINLLLFIAWDSELSL
jgi:hypothetical protein